jgi:hypothetical protein
MDGIGVESGMNLLIFDPKMGATSVRTQGRKPSLWGSDWLEWDAHNY